jgi:HK97 family phage major capsid protein
MKMTREDLLKIVREVAGASYEEIRKANEASVVALRAEFDARLRDAPRMPASEAEERKLELRAVGESLIALWHGGPDGARAYAKSRGWDRAERTISANLGASGGFLIQTMTPEVLMEALRAKSFFRNSGVRVTTLKGALPYPFIATGATANWVGEGIDATQATTTFGQGLLTEKTVICQQPISNRFLRNASSSDADSIIADMVAATAQAQDIAAIRGSGTSATPKGMKYWAQYSENSTGNTASAGDKLVTLETGMKVTTPLFVNEGDDIIVNTERGEYVSRA